MATRADDIFADLIPGGKAPVTAVYGAPAKPDKPDKPNVQWRTLTPAEVLQNGLTPTKVWQMSSDGETKAVGDAAVPEKKQITDAINGLGIDELLTNVQRARELSKNWWATGMSGAIAEMKPGGGTPRDNFKAALGSVQGSIIMEQLQALKNASKTGASGLGALSEREGERMASAVAALTPDMSEGEYQRSFDEIERHARTLQAIRDGKDPSDPATAKQYGLIPGTQPHASVVAPAPGGGDGGGGTGGDPTPGVGELTPEQAAKDKDFLATKPTPEQYAAFLTTLTGKQADPAGAKKRLEAYNAGGAYSGATLDPTYEQRLRQRIAEEDKLGVGESAAGTLANQGLTFNLSDEAAGVGNALSNAILAPLSSDVDFNPVGAYKFGRDAERMRISDARQQLGYGGTAIELGSSLASVNPAGALDAVAPRAAAAVGALAGYGSGEGAGGSAVGTGAGALGGYAVGRFAEPVAAAVGRGVGRLVPNALRTRALPPRGLAPELADAAAAEGVDLNRAMVDPKARPEFGALESDRYAQPIIRDAVENTRGQIEARAAALGDGGTPMEEGAAGGILQKAGSRFIQRSRGVAERLYNRASSLAGDTRIEPKNAIAQVDAEIAQLQPNAETNAGEIDFLQGLRNDLATPGGKTVEELRQLRTSLRGRIAEKNLTASQAEARAIRAMDATQQDVAQGAPDAASAYRRADTYYRERMTHIDDIIKRITGGRVGTADHVLSGEQAFARIKSMASPGGDGRRLAALMRDLTPNERQDIAATIATQIGRRAPDDPFSAQLFLAQTRNLSPSARRTIFGPDGAQSIDNLRRVSRALVEAGQDINRSRSATTLERAGWRRLASGFITSLTGLGGAGVGGAVGGVGGSVTGAVAGAAVAGGAMTASAARRMLSARAMVNPRVSRWLAESAEISSRAGAKRAMDQLRTIIRREPALAAELTPVYQRIGQALSGTMEAPLAAQPQPVAEQNDEQ